METRESARVPTQEPMKPNQEMGTANRLKNEQSPSQALLERIKALRRQQVKQHEELEQRLMAPATPSHKQNVKGLPVSKSPDLQSHPDVSSKESQKMSLSASGIPQILLQHRKSFRNDPGECEEEHTVNILSSQGTTDLHQFTQPDNLISNWPTGLSNAKHVVSRSSPDSDIHHDSISEVHQKLSDINNHSEFRVGGELCNLSEVKACNPSAELRPVMPSQGNKDFDQVLSEKLEIEEIYQSQKYKSTDILSKGQVEAKCTLNNNSETDESHFIPASRGFIKSIVNQPNNVPKIKREFLRKGKGLQRFCIKPLRFKKSVVSTDAQDKESRSRSEKQKTSNSLTSTKYSDSGYESEMIKNVKPVPMMPLKELHLKKAPIMTSCTSDNEIDNNDDCKIKSQEPRLPQKMPRPFPTHSVIKVNLEKQSFRDQQELMAFEKLEELADESSFSSNSSTVLQLLRHGQQSAASTPLHSPAPFLPQGTPIPGEKDEQGYAFESAAHKVQNVHSHPMSTPATVQEMYPQSKPRVYFSSEVVSKEYVPFETEEDDTLTNTSSITDDDRDSVLFTTSDFEELALRSVSLNYNQQVPALCKDERQLLEYSDGGASEMSDSDGNSSSATLTPDVPRKKKSLQPIALEFSPPPDRPPNCASDYIHSIYGKSKISKPKPPKKVIIDKIEQNIKPTHERNHNKVTASQPQAQVDHSDEDIQTYKTLLVAKVSELENETRIFKRENAKLQKLQQSTQEEKQQLADERKRSQEEMAIERKQIQEYVDTERNSLWREKQRLKQQQNPTISEAKEHSLEIVYLKEQIHDLHKEAKKKEALSQFIIKKLNEKIKALEEDIKQLKNKNSSVQNLEKMNLQLKHQLDRVKLSHKPGLKEQPGNPRGRPRPSTKTATIDSINKSLDRIRRNDGMRTVGNTGTKCDTVINKTKQNYFNSNTGFNRTDDAFVINCEQHHVTQEIVSDSIEENVAKINVPHNTTNVANIPLKRQRETFVDQGGTEIADPGKGCHTGAVHPQTSLVPSEENREYEELKEDGTREITYANGNKKEIYANGVIIISYYNKDRKEIHEDRTKYIYGTDQTTHTTFTDGKEVYVFPGGQKETHFPDGSSEVIFADCSERIITADGTEIFKARDGTVMRTNSDGSKVVEFASGQREVHQDGEMRREYPDGTVKLLHPDGRTETHYKSGRIRMKDSEGNIMYDTHQDISSK